MTRMKKLLSITTPFMMAFAMITFISCNAQAPKANLKTDIDSLSYAYGVNIVQAQGLGRFVAQEIDSANYADFVKGFLEGMKIDKKNKKTYARAFGQQIGQQISNQILSQINQDIFSGDTVNTLDKKNLSAGLIAAILNKDIQIEDAQTYAMTAGNKVREEFFEKQHAEKRVANAKFLEENKTKEGVVTLPSGLQYKVIKEGTGAKPTATETVKVNYVGTTIDGQEFDSSIKRGEPVEFALNAVIPGWTVGIQLMSVGAKYQLFIPYNLAYGAQGSPGIPPFATLIFDVDLHEIVKK
jgi:FKBP-type peptidyl-prolyl cis-trans isomerase FklB